MEIFFILFFILVIVLLINKSNSKKRQKKSEYNQDKLKFTNSNIIDSKLDTNQIPEVAEKPEAILEGYNELTENDLLNFLEIDAYTLANKINIERALSLKISNPNHLLDFSEHDPLLKESALIIVTAQQGSASLIQRKLKLGYNRAGRIIDQLEYLNVIGPFDGSKARTVLFTSIVELEKHLNSQLRDRHTSSKSSLYKEKYYKKYQDIIELKADKIISEALELKKQQEFEQERFEIEQEKQKILNDLYLKERQKEIRRKALAELTEEGHLEDVEEDKNSRHIPQQVKDQVWNRDKGMCVKCGSKNRLEFDHIIPYSEGGSNTYRNIQLLCENCNRVKSNKIG